MNRTPIRLVSKPQSSRRIGPGANTAQWDSHILRAWGDHRFNIDVSKILHPPQTGRPSDDPLNMGIARLGIEVRSIDGIYSFRGRHGGMCGRSSEANGELQTCKGRHLCIPCKSWAFSERTRMHHNTSVNISISPRFDNWNLASKDLFGRRSNKAHAPRNLLLLKCFGNSKEGPNGDRCNQTVPTVMTNSR